MDLAASFGRWWRFADDSVEPLVPVPVLRQTCEKCAAFRTLVGCIPALLCHIGCSLLKWLGSVCQVGRYVDDGWTRTYFGGPELPTFIVGQRQDVHLRVARYVGKD